MISHDGFQPLPDPRQLEKGALRCVIAPNTVANFYHCLEIGNPKLHAMLHYHREPTTQKNVYALSAAISNFMFRVYRMGNLRIVTLANQIWPSPCSLQFAHCIANDLNDLAQILCWPHLPTPRTHRQHGDFYNALLRASCAQLRSVGVDAFFT